MAQIDFRSFITSTERGSFLKGSGEGVSQPQTRVHKCTSSAPLTMLPGCDTHGHACAAADAGWKLQPVSKRCKAPEPEPFIPKEFRFRGDALIPLRNTCLTSPVRCELTWEETADPQKKRKVMKMKIHECVCVQDRPGERGCVRVCVCEWDEF